jgi:HEAT repeat protein
MDRDSRTMAGRDTGVLMSSETSVSRFRRPLVEYLISGLEENDKWVRILAADMLGYVGDPRAVKYLKPLLADRDRDLRIIAAHSLDMIDSHQTSLLQSQPDQCASCMIRHIAEEALLRQRSRDENARH